jgi:hypothetical protein
LVPSAADVFRITEVNATLTFAGRGGLIESVDLVQGPASISLARMTPDAAAAAAAAPPACCGATCRLSRVSPSIDRPA